MQKPERNAWIPSWFSVEQTQAWNELPLMNGKVAPHIAGFHQAYQAWYRKWGKLYPRPCIVNDYKHLAAEKAKNLSERSSSVNSRINP